MKYIFVAGAPGSKWSSVVKNIYYSPDIDQSDYTDERTYYHDAPGFLDLMHLGAYYDPGMEFGDSFDRLNELPKRECEAEFDRPFTSTGIRIIKSHVFCHHIDTLKQRWPDCPIITVHRPNDACLGWWVKCGHFDITYPSYELYYKNLREMGFIINKQNRDLLAQSSRYLNMSVSNNHQLCQALGIACPPAAYVQDYAESDIVVNVI